MKAVVPTVVVLGIFLAAVGAEPESQPAGARRGGAGKEMALDLGGKVTLKLVEIPAGKFLMGSPETEKGRGKDETQHEVTISKPFYMGVTDVTVDQFMVFATDSGYWSEAERAGSSPGVVINDGRLTLNIKAGNNYSWRNPSFEQTGDHPVVDVSWNDATAFCNWLSKKSGKTVTLPTEAQWEYACRAGTKTAFPWGDSPDDGKGWANGSDQSLKKKLPNASARWTFFSWDDGFVFTSPVASFKPNAFGLYDMTGNVSQWCQDRYGNYDQEAVTDPTGPATSHTPIDSRVLRGGSWLGDPADDNRGRSAYRRATPAISPYIDRGFRVSVAANPN